MKFGLVGDGKIAHRHRHAIKKNGGRIIRVHDPKYGDESDPLNDGFFDDLDYVTICSPSILHREHIKLCLKYDKKIICEKPMSLPWEPVIDDDRVNIVLQLRWIDLPEKANLVKVVMSRNDDWFKMWEGDTRKTGGLLYHLFVHYIFYFSFTSIFTSFSLIISYSSLAVLSIFAGILFFSESISF